MSTCTKRMKIANITRIGEKIIIDKNMVAKKKIDKNMMAKKKFFIKFDTEISFIFYIQDVFIYISVISNNIGDVRVT